MSIHIEAIEQLIETYPCEHCALVHMGAQGSPKQSWREGDIGKLTGTQVIEAIGQGRMWIHLFRVGQVDKRYAKLLDDIFAEIDRNLGGYETFTRLNGIIISSPNAQVRRSVAVADPRPETCLSLAAAAE